MMNHENEIGMNGISRFGSLGNYLERWLLEDLER